MNTLITPVLPRRYPKPWERSVPHTCGLVAIVSLIALSLHGLHRETLRNGTSIVTNYWGPSMPLCYLPLILTAAITWAVYNFMIDVEGVRVFDRWQEYAENQAHDLLHTAELPMYLYYAPRFRNLPFLGRRLWCEVMIDGVAHRLSSPKFNAIEYIDCPREAYSWTPRYNFCEEDDEDEEVSDKVISFSFSSSRPDKLTYLQHLAGPSNELTIRLPDAGWRLRSGRVQLEPGTAIQVIGLTTHKNLV